MKGLDANLLRFLKDPEKGSDLSYDGHNLLLTEEKEISYMVKDGIPIMLRKESVANESYIEHYQLDAKYFDYFRLTPLSWRMENNRLHQNIIKASRMDDIDTVMDVGSGGGWLVKHVIDKTSAKIIAFDISYDNIRRLQELYPSERHMGMVGDALNLPLKDDSLDRIFAIEILEHVPKPKEFVSNMLNAINPNGKLILSTPYKENIEHSLCIHCNKPTPRHAHLHSFDEMSLLELVPSKGFRVKFIKCNNSMLLKLRMHILLRFLPFSIWNIIDQFFVKMTGKAERIVMQIVKE